MEEVQSATAQVIHLVLQPNPEPTMAQIWNQIERLIVQHINPGFLQDLVEQIEIMQDGNQLTTDEVQDIATCAVMQEVEEILQGVISRHPPEVQQKAKAKVEEVNKKLAKKKSNSSSSSRA
eukprot:CAMPEP_0114658988 /NCGR_PEP_ID=MMETSP0191-20121206/16852_1 /TAXON_ID=126664 /ORGANISM="Sorites sp." /LENGTH=120 /DNA_ID=CAMNT_0001882669 /DNA_START=66 /DNA_END=428 /DNA_ORIENTATION=+